MNIYEPITDTDKALAALRSILAMAVGKGAITRAGYDHGHEAIDFLESSPAPADGWQPIETAPMDSEKLIHVSDGVLVELVKAINGMLYCLSPSNLGWQQFTRFFATHWRPMPAPPEGNCKLCEGTGEQVEFSYGRLPEYPEKVPCDACQGTGKAGEVAK
jgi:hypothetical protein